MAGAVALGVGMVVGAAQPESVASVRSKNPIATRGRITLSFDDDTRLTRSWYVWAKWLSTGLRLSLIKSMGTTRRKIIDDQGVGASLVFARAEINAANAAQRGRSPESPYKSLPGIDRIEYPDLSSN